ncbi:MAG: PorV/PorQ family protein [bacterium]|nr:PorV/PorQ family protein [bacterium]
MRFIVAVIVFVLVTPKVYPATSGETAMNFLKIDPGARASGMAGAFSSYGGDAFAVFYNPALAVKLTTHKVDLMHYEYFEDLNYENLSSSFRISPDYSAGVAAGYLYSGPITRTVRADNMEGFESTGRFFTSDLLLLVFNSFRLEENVSAGISMKYLRETIADEKATSFAVDLGFTARLKFLMDIDFSLSVLNLGLPVKFTDKKEDLPVIIKSGISRGFSPFRLNSRPEKKDLNLVLDAEKPSDNDLDLRLGTEIWFMNMFAVRAGYLIRMNSNDLGSLSLGAGLEIDRFDLNYAFVPYKYLENTHRFSLGVKF